MRVPLVPRAAACRLSPRRDQSPAVCVGSCWAERCAAVAAARPLPEPSAALQAIVGHYRSHNPWTTNFRVVLRGRQPWLIFPAAPDGFDTEQPLIPSDDGTFRVGEDPGNPETLRFDTVIEGRALRAWLSGWPYYRHAEVILGRADRAIGERKNR